MKHKITQFIDKKKHTWETTTSATDDPEHIEITTWKGIYVIDNPKPHHEMCINIDLFGFWFIRIVCRDGIVTTMGYKFYHPLTHKWVDGSKYSEIMHDILDWVLAQPPQPDWKGAEEDRRSVEAEFEKIVGVSGIM
jgi:hypothetical protein